MKKNGIKIWQRVLSVQKKVARSIYHYKPKRIKSHILICYLAFSR